MLVGCITVLKYDPQSAKNWEYAEKIYVEDTNNPKLTLDEKLAGQKFFQSAKQYEESKYAADNKN